MRSRPTSSMKKGWLCRTSYDEIVYPWWWLVEIQIDLWSRSSYDDFERSRSSDDPDLAVMIQMKTWSKSRSRLSDDPDPVQWWWSKSSDDPDPVMLIQIERWSKSSDDVPWWSRSRDDPYSKNEDDLKMKMTWRLKRLKMQRMRWSIWYKE